MLQQKRRLYYKIKMLLLLPSTLYSLTFFPQQKIDIISQMGCENSNLVEVVPHADIENIQPQTHIDNDQKITIGETPHHESKESKGKPIKQNPSVVIVGDKQNRGKEQQGEQTKRKTKSEFKISENIMNDKTNIQQPSEKKKSWVVGQKSKILSARDKEKVEHKVQFSNQEVPCGPSSKSIECLPQIELNKLPTCKKISGAVQKLQIPSVQLISESVESHHKDDSHSSVSNGFKFEVFAQSSAEILSKTQRLNKKMEEYLEKQEVSRFLSMIQYGQKQQIIGKVYQQLEKRERWSESPSENGDKLLIVQTLPAESQK